MYRFIVNEFIEEKKALSKKIAHTTSIFWLLAPTLTNMNTNMLGIAKRITCV